MLTIIAHIVLIFFQFFVSMALSVFFGKIFEWIYTKGNPRSFKAEDTLKEERLSSKLFLFTGISILGLTIAINIFYGPMIGFYLGSFLYIFLGADAFSPNLRKGKKITDNCWVSRCDINDFIVTLNDHKMLITGERLKGKPSQVIYAENSPKWLPPHDSEPVPEKDYEYMLEAILKFLKNSGEILKPGQDIGPSLTREDMIARFAQKGWKVEKSPTGILVSPPRKKKR